MTFASLDSSTNDIAIIFSTTKPNSLLVYNYGEQIGGRSDFVAIELIQGRATFSFGGVRTAVGKFEQVFFLDYIGYKVMLSVF